MPISISDSIVDAMSSDREALGAPGHPVAHAVLTIRRCTVFGIVDVHAIELAENCIFSNCLNVARRQLGCMRFCYVPPGCRTPRRYHCQPDLAAQAAKDEMPLAASDAEIAGGAGTCAGTGPPSVQQRTLWHARLLPACRHVRRGDHPRRR